MTENEAIEILNEVQTVDDSLNQYIYGYDESFNMAIEALKEIKQYRAIGTAKECSEAIEKQKAKKVIIRTEYEREFEDYVCPNCKVILQQRMKNSKYITIYKYKYCLDCGQKLDWED